MAPVQDDDVDEHEPEQDTEVRSAVLARTSLQMARSRAFDAGDYELHEWEGFTCTECGWHGLHAPVNDEWFRDDQDRVVGDDMAIVVCPECGTPDPDTSDERTRWHVVIETLVNGPATVDMTE
jgi:hypothetical protein